MSKKRDEKPYNDFGDVCGMVRCCKCGSRDVRGYARTSIKRRRVTAVEYVCKCGNRYVAGNTDLALSPQNYEEARRRDFYLGGEE